MLAEVLQLRDRSSWLPGVSSGPAVALLALTQAGGRRRHVKAA
jgi:hypothetical protein